MFKLLYDPQYLNFKTGGIMKQQCWYCHGLHNQSDITLINSFYIHDLCATLMEQKTINNIKAKKICFENQMAK